MMYDIKFERIWSTTQQQSSSSIIIVKHHQSINQSINQKIVSHIDTVIRENSHYLSQRRVLVFKRAGTK
jgi:hypothetical protein